MILFRWTENNAFFIICHFGTIEKFHDKNFNVHFKVDTFFYRFKFCCWENCLVYFEEKERKIERKSERGITEMETNLCDAIPKKLYINNHQFLCLSFSFSLLFSFLYADIWLFVCSICFRLPFAMRILTHQISRYSNEVSHKYIIQTVI